MGRVIGQREVRPVWNNAQRVNYQNKLAHPHPKRNFIPTGVATKSGLVLVNAAKQSSPKEAASISTARHVNTVASKLRVNAASPTKYSYFKAHLPLKRPFNQKSAVKTNNFNKKIYNAKLNNVTTAGPEVVDNPQYALQDQGIFGQWCQDTILGVQKLKLAFWSKNSVNSSEPTLSIRPTNVEVPKELPKVSMVNTSLKKLKYHLANLMWLSKKGPRPQLSLRVRGFEHTKACFRDEIIPFVKALKDLFSTFNQHLVDELSEVQNVFYQLEQAVEQHRIE
ncbi:hypothetical protein Tco_1031116 [Tanacetum coccineum]|uniref:Uncharacterized protein n=1 Tax=Tanacetum coccineum TaxID=301880 RepID=A0ABQ5G8J7_9ASTR